ncbi:MAG: WD40 repeat domain-containing protein, partial [SAR202 cluster bacterium]|nr:WD40 repeat domain-containing protein [SAR202 cluster bacterium]
MDLVSDGRQHADGRATSIKQGPGPESTQHDRPAVKVRHGGQDVNRVFGVPACPAAGSSVSEPAEQATKDGAIPANGAQCDFGVFQNLAERPSSDRIRWLWPLLNDAPDNVEENRRAFLEAAFRSTILFMPTDQRNRADGTCAIKSAWVMHSSRIQALAFSADSAFVASGSLDSHIYVWNVSKKRRKTALKLCHQGGVTGVAWTGTDTV